MANYLSACRICIFLCLFVLCLVSPCLSSLCPSFPYPCDACCHCGRGGGASFVCTWSPVTALLVCTAKKSVKTTLKTFPQTGNLTAYVLDSAAAPGQYETQKTHTWQKNFLILFASLSVTLMQSPWYHSSHLSQPLQMIHIVKSGNSHVASTELIWYNYTQLTTAVKSEHSLSTIKKNSWPAEYSIRFWNYVNSSGDKIWVVHCYWLINLRTSIITSFPLVTNNITCWHIYSKSVLYTNNKYIYLYGLAVHSWVLIFTKLSGYYTW